MTTELAKRNLWPAIDPLRSHSRLLDPAIVGTEHVEVARRVRDTLRRASELQAGATPHTDEDERILARARKLEHFFTQPFFVAEPYTKRPGAYVPRKVTVRDCAAILAGEYDHLPDADFLYRGSLDDIAAEPSAR
jgi:F-type H+-transporting ATPase subunit beta